MNTTKIISGEVVNAAFTTLPIVLFISVHLSVTFNQTEAQRANKIFFGDQAPPLSKGLDDQALLPLSQGLDPPLTLGVVSAPPTPLFLWNFVLTLKNSH